MGERNDQEQDALKSGNIIELYEKLKEGNTDHIQDYIKQATEKAKNNGMGKNMEQYMKMIPGGDKDYPCSDEARGGGEEAWR